MSEIILAWIGSGIMYTYMLAVIAFVALQFGWIKRPGESLGAPAPRGGLDARPEAGGKPADFASIMQGMMSQVAPMFQQMQAPGVPSGAPADDQLEVIDEKPATTQFE